jgi:hypothetical protein
MYFERHVEFDEHAIKVLGVLGTVLQAMLSSTGVPQHVAHKFEGIWASGPIYNPETVLTDFELGRQAIISRNSDLNRSWIFIYEIDQAQYVIVSNQETTAAVLKRMMVSTGFPTCCPSASFFPSNSSPSILQVTLCY